MLEKVIQFLEEINTVMDNLLKIFVIIVCWCSLVLFLHGKVQRWVDGILFPLRAVDPRTTPIQIYLPTPRAAVQLPGTNSLYKVPSLDSKYREWYGAQNNDLKKGLEFVAKSFREKAQEDERRLKEVGIFEGENEGGYYPFTRLAN